jgi:hypothetical protein
MAKSLAQLTIFVSGTMESNSERTGLRRVAEELNKRLEKTFSVTLRVISWPEDIRPGAHQDPQAEVNRQIGPGYDIYVGILGTYFGTPTRHAGSGTEEEFNEALKRFKENSKSLRLLFYFKNSAQDIYSMDLQQMELVKKFRNSLASKGILYKEFSDTPDFLNKIQDHLWNLIEDEWSGDEWKEIVPVGDLEGSYLQQDIATDESTMAKEEDVLENADDREDELGFLDYIENFSSSADRLTGTMEKISTFTRDIGNQMLGHTEEIKLFQNADHISGSRAENYAISKAKYLVDAAGLDLGKFADFMEPEVESFRNEIRTMLISFRGAMLIGAEMGGSEKTVGNKEKFSQLVATMEGAQHQLIGFQESIHRLTPLTKNFRRFRNRATSILGELIAELFLSINEGKRILGQLD